MSLHFAIFTEAFVSTLWPMKVEVTAEAMKHLGGFDMVQAAALSTAGAMVAAVVLWAAGRAMRRFMQQRGIGAAIMEKAGNKDFFSEPLGLLMLVLLWLPIGFAVALAAGFLRVPLWKLAALGTLGCGSYYFSMFLWL